MPTVTSPATDISPEVALHVEDTGGDGRPVVLIHGWPLNGQSWGAQVEALVAAGHRVVTYDRRGFGRSGKPLGTFANGGYAYDTFAADLAAVVEQLDLRDVTLVGFSMGGGEVARYVGTYGEERVHSIAFVAAIPPCLAKTHDNPEGPMDDSAVASMQTGLQADREGFLSQFMVNFYSANGELKVTQEELAESLAMAAEADLVAAVECIAAFSLSDFREDLTKVTVPTLVVHGDADAIVPFEASGKRTAETIPGAQLVVLADGPHGINVSHADELSAALVEFAGR
jgi:non-heme chloroperoxidase